ncbi:putative transporter SEO1 [Wickerhamomyces ciferrii]|uniref:Transporter SEO1 n=1 Tax=Wickerhamomyces ciferrii (strain ATCC 14091 / BCRC 22168 / CBS 111 / JCM 3599 / NBRC 0793 / NRRL Y-1031 F-60-10) TaxID=1206466 RepID=K0KUB4_WICCF|nr:putative transporter SEO1 [Wickerhamomyces ciferrii]CCH44778.1 putative transporter SEO1 [Wickerhamomyces ciferrii]
MNFLRQIKLFLWGHPPTSHKERKLLFKIDCFVLSFVCLNYWVNYLDRTNFSNAYVSGMQEDLGMGHNEFNIVNTVFTVGYILGMIPNNLILLVVRPKYWLTFCLLVWGTLTLGMYKVENYKQICILRFFMAFFESSTFVGSQLILGSWYNSKIEIDEKTGRVATSELGKRSAIFTTSGLLGSIFSSFMQSSIYKNMHGLNGLAGWRWLFIIDFIITMPVMIYGFIFFPDTPDTCNSFYFTKEEIQLAKERLIKTDPMEPTTTPKKTKLDWSVISRVFGNWHWYLFSILWIFGGENVSFCSNSLFALWLKHKNYTIPQRNQYPIGIFAIGIISTFLAALYVDHTGGKNHHHIGLIISIVLITSSIMILSKPNSHAVMFIAQYLAGVSYSGQAVFFSWANLICRGDLQERAIVLASMNMFSGAVNAWWSLLFFSESTAPLFKKGCYAMIGTCVGSAATCLIIQFLVRKREKKLVRVDSSQISI